MNIKDICNGKLITCFYEKLLYFSQSKYWEESFIVFQSSSMSREWKTTGFSYLLLCAILCGNVLVEL